MTRFLKAIVQAEKFVKENPSKAQSFVAKRFHFEPQYVQRLWSKNQFVVSLPQSLLLAMEHGALWLIDNKVTEDSHLPDFLNMVYFEGLRPINPSAITILTGPEN